MSELRLSERLRFRILQTAEREQRAMQWLIVVRPANAESFTDRGAVLEAMDVLGLWREIPIRDVPVFEAPA